MAVYLPIQALNRSQNVRIGTTLLQVGVTSYVDITNGTVKRDLQRHSALGAYLVVGPLASANSDSVVINGGIVSAGTGLTVNVSTGEIRKRSTDTYVTGASAANFALSSSSIGASNERTDLIHWDATSGAVGKTDGTVAAAGASVLPAVPAGKVPLASVLVANAASAPGTIGDLRPRP